MQFARIQPVHLTTFAAIDDRVPGPRVDVTEHRLPASRTVENPVSWILATRQRCAERAFFAGTQGVDETDEAVHVDQHAETARATESILRGAPQLSQFATTGLSAIPTRDCGDVASWPAFAVVGMQCDHEPPRRLDGSPRRTAWLE